MSDKQPQELASEPAPGSIIRGALLGFALNIGAIFLSALAGTVSMDSIGVGFFAIAVGIGLGQLLWLIPMVRSYRRSGATETAKGLIIAGAITFLLNAGCWGLILGGDFRFAG